jgi:hypothetical protein
LNDRKPKALDDESSILDTDIVDEHVSCSSDSESDGDEKNDYAKCKIIKNYWYFWKLINFMLQR